MSAPDVTIGLPVFNGEPHLAEAIECLLGQTYGEFVLLISDNASTDGTEQLCRAYAARDRRVRYSRNPTNIGVYANFARVLSLAETEYYMVAAADDRHDPRFLEATRRLLEEDASRILAFCHVEGIDPQGRPTRCFPRIAELGRPAPTLQRLHRLLWSPEADGKANVVYGLTRTPAARAAGALHRYSRNDWGRDYLTLFRLAGFGEIAIAPDVLFRKREVLPCRPRRRLLDAVAPPMPLPIDYTLDYLRVLDLMPLEPPTRAALRASAALRALGNVALAVWWRLNRRARVAVGAWP
jgi:glycosyltransferase involved in cell wall biosynthesis